MMAILMFSLAGLPPFIGFWAKLGVIQAVLDVNYTWLAVVAVLFSVVGAFYYLRIVKLMYFDEPTESTVIGGSVLMRTVLSANALLVFGLGVAPAALLAALPAGAAVEVPRSHSRSGTVRIDCENRDWAACIRQISRVQWAALRCGVEQSGSSSGS